MTAVSPWGHSEFSLSMPKQSLGSARTAPTGRALRFPPLGTGAVHFRRRVRIHCAPSELSILPAVRINAYPTHTHRCAFIAHRLCNTIPPPHLTPSVRINAHPTFDPDAMTKTANLAGARQIRVSPDCANNTRCDCENRPRPGCGAPKIVAAKRRVRAVPCGWRAENPSEPYVKTAL